MQWNAILISLTSINRHYALDIHRWEPVFSAAWKIITGPPNGPV